MSPCLKWKFTTVGLLALAASGGCATTPAGPPRPAYLSTQYVLDHKALANRPSLPLPAISHEFPNTGSEPITAVIGIAVVENGPVLAAARCKTPGYHTFLEFDGAEWKARAWKGPFHIPPEEAYVAYNGAGISIDLEDTDGRLVAASKTHQRGSHWPALEAASNWAMLRLPFDGQSRPPDAIQFRTTSEILSVAADGDQRGAVGTRDGLYLREKGKEFEPATPAIEGERLALKDVGALHYDTAGRLWVGCDRGVLIFDGAHWTLDEPAETFDSGTFTCAVSETGGAMWFGAENGAYRRDDTGWRRFSGPEWLPADRVNDIAAGPGGAVWLATPAGIACLKPQQPH